MTRLWPVVLAALVSTSIAPRDARACAAAPPKGAEVIIAAEEALIAWDATTHTEQFIRRAQFSSTAKDFGFLVPTPAAPKLAEADAGVFERLHELTKPVVRETTELRPQLSCLTLFSRAASGEKAAAQVEPVRVLSIEKVAGYEAAILQADDAEALRKWLESHGYEARPALTEWLAPYVANKWTVTAFKIADAAGAGRPASSAVRMTFTAERPFYPYREPSDGPKSPYPERTLRVFLVSAGRMQGTVGSGPFAGELRYARSNTGLAKVLAGAVEGAPDAAWLHDFVDRSTPRPGTDELFFGAAPAATEIVPPPLVVVHEQTVFVPLDLILLLGAGALLIVRLTRRHGSE